MAEMLRLAEMMIDAANIDDVTGSLILGSPLAYAYASRSVGRWAHGQQGWRDDFDRAVAMGRNTDPMSQNTVTAVTYGMAIGYNIISAGETALRDIQAALDAAERSADDLALGFATFVMGVALLEGGLSQVERGLQLLSLNPWMGRWFDRRVNSENAF